jgi:hypothetical protein
MAQAKYAQTVSVHISNDIAEKIAEMAEERGISWSRMVREIILLYGSASIENPSQVVVPAGVDN